VGRERVSSKDNRSLQLAITPIAGESDRRPISEDESPPSGRRDVDRSHQHAKEVLSLTLPRLIRRATQLWKCRSP
jgi:hypothetical protein